MENITKIFLPTSLHKGVGLTGSFKRTDLNEPLVRESDNHHSDDSEHATLTLWTSLLMPSCVNAEETPQKLSPV